MGGNGGLYGAGGGGGGDVSAGQQNGGNGAQGIIVITYTVGAVDNTPPVISSITSGTLEPSAATIIWSTDEPANSEVEFGTTASYGSSTQNAIFTTNHSITLSGLAASTTYHYEIVSANPEGDSATSTDHTFTTLNDGFAGAPSGTPQYQTLLNGYASRTPWNVAGIDYYVGVPSGTVLQDPSTISMANVSVDTTDHLINVNGPNVTLNGYDFSLDGGWQVDVTNTDATNVTIENSNFKVGSNNLVSIEATYGGFITVLDNTFDNGGSSGGSAAYAIQVGTGALIEYNRFTDMAQDGIGIAPGNPAGNYTIQYNLFDSLGWNSVSHNEDILVFGSSPTSLVVDFNTWYQPTGEGLATTNSFIRIGDEGAGNTVNNPVTAYNTIILPAADQSAYVFDISSTSGLCVNPTVFNNYVDPTGAIEVNDPYLTTTTNYTNYNNINLTNGATILNGGESGPPSAPTITGDSVSSGQVTLTGTAPASTTIDVLDPTNVNPWSAALYGTATANGSGAWTFTTAQLANGTWAFVARATDAAGNTSAASSPLNVTI